MARRDIIIVGGGIAGLATALPLAQAGRGVLLLEREPILASHSSGRNAAIWLPAYADDATTPQLSRRSVELLQELAEPRAGGWIARIGALLVSGDPTLLEAREPRAERCGMRVRRIDGDQAARLSPALVGGTVRAALLLPDAGVLDVHAITEMLARAAREAGAEIRTGCGVARVVTRGGRVEGVELEDGSRCGVDAVVLAAGAWAASLGASCGAPLPLAALRRHLVHLGPPAVPLGGGPIVWSLGDEAYYRPESGGLLASPCDEEPFRPCLPPADTAALVTLAHKLRSLAPGLSESRVRRLWACLRTFAPDREIVAGPDPRVEGLFWLAGLGGRGMTVGAAAGELAAAGILRRNHPLVEVASPARLLTSLASAETAGPRDASPAAPGS